MDDTAVMKVIVVMVTMITLSALAEADGNNPMTEIGLPVSAEDFNLYSLAGKAPQMDSLAPPVFENETRACSLGFFCPVVSFGEEVARAIWTFSINFVNFIVFIVNAVITGATIAGLLVFNFLTLFNFASWNVFQGQLFLTLFGVGLTVMLGGTVVLWVFDKIRGSIPFVGG